jgi:hypothetical protein
MSISDFQVNMMNFARPNLFRVEIYNSQGSSNFARDFTFKCHTCSIPGLDIATTDKDMGYRSFAYQKIYNDVSMSFYCRENMLELKYFQDWMKKIIKPEDNHVGYYSSYISNIKIIKLDRQQEKSMETTLIDAYPKSVEGLELSFGSSDVMSVNVNFTYRYYEQTFVEASLKENKKGELGDNTETSAEDINGDIDKKTVNYGKNKQGFFVPIEHRINQ